MRRPLRAGVLAMLALATVGRASAQELTDGSPPPPPESAPVQAPVAPAAPDRTEALDAARPMLDELLVLRPADPVLLLTALRVRWAQGDYRGAAAVASRLEAVQPGHVEAALARAVADSRRGDRQLAVAGIETAASRGLSAERYQFARLIARERLDLARALRLAPSEIVRLMEEDEAIEHQRTLAYLLVPIAVMASGLTAALLVTSVTSCFIVCADPSGTLVPAIGGAITGVLTLVLLVAHGGMLSNARGWRRRWRVELARTLRWSAPPVAAWRF